MVWRVMNKGIVFCNKKHAVIKTILRVQQGQHELHNLSDNMGIFYGLFV